MNVLSANADLIGSEPSLFQERAQHPKKNIHCDTGCTSQESISSLCWEGIIPGPDPDAPELPPPFVPDDDIDVDSKAPTTLQSQDK